METPIKLLGIVRNTSNLNSPAGSCQELINLRKKLGSWRPILPKSVVATNFTSINNEVLIHTMDENSYFIIYNPGDGKVKAYDGTTPFAEVETLTTLAAALDIKIDSLGDFIIITDLTNYEKHIFRYYADEATKYTNVSNIPFINLSFSSINQITTSFGYSANYNNDSFQAGWVLLEKDARETYPEYFEGYVFIRWGIELIDGTILKHSAPVFIYNGSITLTDAPPHVLITSVLCKIAYQIQASLPSDWANYKNLIRGISIFMTKPDSKYSMDESGLTKGGVFIGLVKKPGLLSDYFRTESIYYRVHHVPYNKIAGGGGDYIGAGKPILKSNIFKDGEGGAAATRERSTRGMDIFFPAFNINPDKTTPLATPYQLNITDITAYDILNVDDTSHHNLLGINSLNYNSRIFLGDIYTKLFSGYHLAEGASLPLFYTSIMIIPTGGTITAFDLYVEVDIATSVGKRTVRQHISSTKDSIKVPYILGYPDIRATEIRILHNIGGTFKTTFSLESHPILNFAFASKQDGTDITIQAKDVTDGMLTIPITDINIPATLATLSNDIRDKNRIQLTELYNPFITPAIYSYQVGEGNIMSIAVNMIPLEDRFGTFPVFVFTSRGVWALNLSDTGSVVISNIAPVSPAVCINGDSVIVVDNLLVFLASDGIKLLTGQTPAEISDLVEGPFASILADNTVYDEIIAKSVLNDVTTQLSSTDILTYAAGAKFAYDKNLREIIISNYDYEYSYMYSLDEKMWYKCSQRYKKFISNYPNCYALTDGNDLTDISQESPSDPDATGIYFETKPILIGPDKELKLNKTILGGRFDIADSFFGALYIFGSNDGSVWSIITGKEIEGENIYNIVIPRLPLSLRYVIFIFTGTMMKNSALSEFRLTTYI